MNVLTQVMIFGLFAFYMFRLDCVIVGIYYSSAICFCSRDYLNFKLEFRD